MQTPALTLNDGHQIPQLGFGVFQVPPAETAAVVTAALEVGYRHIDTAQMYGNEKGVGEAVAGIGRDELFLTTKLNNNNHRPADVDRSLDESLAALGVDRVDLFLIHWPLPTRYDGDYVSTWRAMAATVEDGRARSAGVSNFEPDHLRRIIDETGALPAVNQIEVHPFFGNEAARAAGTEHGVLTEAWAPIAKGQVVGEAVLEEIGARHGKTAAQVALRWHLERGDVVFPKSVHAERMRENADVLDFSLTPDEVAAITALDRGRSGRLGPHPDEFDHVPD